MFSLFRVDFLDIAMEVIDLQIGLLSSIESREVVLELRKYDLGVILVEGEGCHLPNKINVSNLS
jgi:hypothetical protein